MCRCCQVVSAPLVGGRNAASLIPPPNFTVFKGCDNLKVAEGTFPGSVDFTKSGLEKSRNLNITRGTPPIHLTCSWESDYSIENDLPH